MITPQLESCILLLRESFHTAWVAFSYQVEAIAPTVLEAINKVGSLANGPLLGLFAIALITPGVGQQRALAGFAIGFISNLATWLWLPQVSWLWWNVIGCVIAILSALLFTLPGGVIGFRAPSYSPARNNRRLLLAMSVLILATCVLLNWVSDWMSLIPTP